MGVRIHRVELAGGAALSVEETGEGPALLMLHAGVADRHMWDGQWDWLQRSFRVVRWDWRGFGDTPHVPGPFSYADDVLRVMDALGLPQATLMGCSFGGSVAIQVAAQHPERVERLVLVGSGLPGYEAANHPEVQRLFAEEEEARTTGDQERAMALMEQLWLVGPNRRADQVDASYLARARQLLARTDRPDNGATSLDRDWSALEMLHEIQIPVLAVVGEEDVPDIVQAAQVLAKALPKVRLERLEDAAHLPNLERPRAFDAILADWLAQTGRGAAEDSGGAILG